MLAPSSMLHGGSNYALSHVPRLALVDALRSRRYLVALPTLQQFRGLYPPTQAQFWAQNHGAVKMKFALATSTAIAVFFLLLFAIDDEEQGKMVHHFKCDGTEITIHDRSIREASAFAVQHCTNFTMLP